jgi:trk system potassium uptake protein TrkA
MKILILGAGQVGSTVAAQLAREERNDVTVVDRRPELLKDLAERLDLRTVEGHAAHPDVLRRAGAAEAEMIMAVTDSDEVNMVACQVAFALWKTPFKIARVRGAEYLAVDGLFSQQNIPIDFAISPEQLVTEHIRRLIQYPGALQVLDFAGGKVRMIAVRAKKGGPMVGSPLKVIREHVPDVETRVAAIYRRGQAIIPEGDTVIEAGDEVFVIAARRDIRTVISELRKLERPVRRMIIAGGGHIGIRLAQALETTYDVKLIERDQERALEIAQALPRTVVLSADAADEDLLKLEGIAETDVFCAVTNDEKTNILAALLAKRNGAAKVMAIINRPAFAELMQGSDIDVAISPQQITISRLLQHVRRGDVAAVHSLRRGAAEAIEVVAHGDPVTSKVVERRLDEIPLPPGATIGAIVRGEEVLMAHHDTVIHSNDHLIVFVVDRAHIPDVERLFQADVSFG